MLNYVRIYNNNFPYIDSSNINKFYYLAILIVGTIILALAAQIQIAIPLFPVPITLQTFVILLIGASVGSKLGGQIVLLYLSAGICGLPVFAGYSWGLTEIVGPTGGYLVGFIFYAYLIGYLLQHGWAKNRVFIFMAALLADIILFGFGYVALASFVGFHDAYLFGIVPFYFVELSKLSLFTLITPHILCK